MEDDKKIIHNEHELMTALTMFFAVFWSGEKKFSQIVIRSREGSLQKQTRVSIDFRDHKELWNMVIQDYLKSQEPKEKKDEFVREELRLLLGGMQKKRYDALLSKMPVTGLEIEEDITGFGRKHFAVEVEIKLTSSEVVSKYQLLEREGKFYGKVSWPEISSSVEQVLQKLIQTFQEEQVFGRVLFEFVYVPATGQQAERVVLLGTEEQGDEKTLQESLSRVAFAEVKQGELVAKDPALGEESFVAFLLDQDSAVKSEELAPMSLRDMLYSEGQDRGVVFPRPGMEESVVPQGALLYLAKGKSPQQARENLVLLYEQVLNLCRDPKAREKLLSLS